MASSYTSYTNGAPSGSAINARAAAGGTSGGRPRITTWSVARRPSTTVNTTVCAVSLPSVRQLDAGVDRDLEEPAPDVRGADPLGVDAELVRIDRPPRLARPIEHEPGHEVVGRDRAIAHDPDLLEPLLPRSLDARTPAAADHDRERDEHQDQPLHPPSDDAEVPGSAAQAHGPRSTRARRISSSASGGSWA